MSRRGKRGLSRCKKNYPAESYVVTFNDLGLVDSDTAPRFASWMGVEETWNISDDVANENKKVLLRKMNEYHRKFKTNLTHIAQAGKDPLLEYKDLNMEDWPAFVAIRNSPAFLEKSAKAKENALKNKDRPKLGRTTYVGLEKKLEPLMEDLERRYPELAKLECRRSKLHIFARLLDNDFTSLKELTKQLYDKLKALLVKEQEMKADGTFYVAGKDPITGCFGPEHSGRTRCVSNVVGNKKALGISKRTRKNTLIVEDFDGLKEEITKPLREKIEVIEADLELLQATLNAGGSFTGLLQGTSSTGGSFDRFDSIEVPTPCDLLVPYGDIEETMAKAMLYPRLDGILDGIQMRPGYSKVQVDTVEEAYMNSFVVVPTDAVSRLSESFGYFIQWPQKYIKLRSQLVHVEPSMPTKSRLDENALQRMVDEETSCRAKTSFQISHNSYQTDRMKHLKKRPIDIQWRAKLFMDRENPNAAINIESPDGMYDEKFLEPVDSNSLIGWMSKDWLDVAIIHWLCMFLFKLPKQNSRTAFLNPAYLQSKACLEDRGFVVTHTRKTFLIHQNKSFFLLPYHQDGHWALFIIDRSMHKGYIFDSYNKDQKKTPDDFLVVKVLNEALQVNLDWTFPKCNQQRETWECGYYVMKWMGGFFMIIQQGFPDNIPTHFVSRKPIPMSLLDKMVHDGSKSFYDLYCQPCKESI